MDHEINFVPLYSGGSLYLPGQIVPVVLDIAGLDVPAAPIPCWLEHNPDKRCGTLDRVEVGRNQNGTPCVNAYGSFARDPPADAFNAREVKLKRDQGVRWESSIHTLRPNPLDIEVIPEGVEVEINGRTFVGPLKAFRKWGVLEGSFVFIGGDPYNAVEIAATGRRSHAIIEMENESMSPELIEYINAVWPDYDIENMQPEQAAIFERCFKAANGAAEAEGECDPEKKEEPAVAEGETAPEKKEEPAVSSGEAETEKKEEPAVASGEGETEKKDEPVAASGDFATRNPARNLGKGRVASTGSPGTPNINDVLTIAMMDGLGMKSEEIAASGSFKNKQAAMNEGLSKRYRNITLKGMFCEAFEKRLGGRWTGREAGFASRALQLMHNDGAIMASGSFSTVSPLTIIQNILQLQYRAGFENFEGVAEKLSDINYNDNLMAAKMANYDVSGGLQEVGEDGEIQHGTLKSEEIETQVYTYATILTLTEAMIINDRLDALSKLTGKQGRKAKIQRERAWFKEFMAQDTTLCTSGRGNLITNALGIGGLSAAAAALAAMETIGSTSADPEFTELEGKFLLVPHALLPTAQTLYVDTKCDLVGLGEHLESNPHVNDYEPVSSTYYGSKMATYGGSDTQWALFGDPAVCPAMIISHLRGEEKPRIEKLPVQPNILGYSFRTVYRYGITTGDYRGVVYSTGAGS